MSNKTNKSNYPTKKNIDRLLKQRHGDQSLLLLGIYSLIEGYIRDKIPRLDYEKNKIRNDDSEEDKTYKRKNHSFHRVLREFFKTESKPRLYEEIKKYKREKGLKEDERIPDSDMSTVYDNLENNSDLYTFLFNEIEVYHREYANAVRHIYENIDSGFVNTAISQFIDFAQMENFYTPELENLSDFSDWKNRTPPEDNEQYNKLIEENKKILEKSKENEIALGKVILELQKSERRNEQLELEKDELLNQKKEIAMTNKELKQKKYELQEEIRRLSNQENKDAFTKEEISKLQEELERVIKEKDQQENLLNEKQQQIDFLSKSNETLAEQNKELAKEKEKLEDRFNKYEIDAKNIKKEIIELNEHGDGNQEKLQNLQAEYEKIILLKNDWENQLIEKQAEIDKLNQSYIDLSTMTKDLERQKIETENILQETLNESNELRLQIRELEQKPLLTPEKEQELEKLQERYTNLKKVLENQRKLRDEIQKEHLEQVESIQRDAEIYLENTNILQAYTSAARNYHARILKLSPEQEEIVDTICSSLIKIKDTDTAKDFLIKGGPGTGKTLVLIKILERFATKITNKNVKLLTFTDSLNKYNQYLSQEYEKKNPEADESISQFMKDNIQTFDSYFAPKISEILGKDIFYLNIRNEHEKESSEYKSIFSIFEALTPDKDHANQAMNEAFNEIWTFSPTKEDYISKVYSGDNIALTEEKKKNREDIWNTVERASIEIEKRGSIPIDFAYYKISSDERYNLLSDTDKIDYLLIDEIQDLSPARIKVISKLNKRACVMAGDVNQSVFIKRKLSWVALSIKLKGRGKVFKLEKNYRSTINIQKLANRYREICAIKDDTAISESFIPGQEPELSVSKNLEIALEEILNKIKCYIDVLGFNPEDICIVLPTDEELNRIKEYISNHNLKSMAMVEPDFNFERKGIIRLSTTNHVKGIDSPVIILLLTGNFTNQKKNGVTDSMSQMNSIYSCITRTMDSLYVQVTEDALSSNLDIKGENSITKLLKVWNN